MIQILQRLGIGTSLPAGSDAFLQPDVSGRASATFLAVAPSASVPGDNPNRAETDSDATALENLAYPGKKESLTVANRDAIDYVYRLSISDLPSQYYVRQPPVGGQWESEGGVVLAPEQTAQFDVQFVPVEGKPPPRPFYLIITRFDTRRAAADGEVIAELPLRWVPAPTASDFRLHLTPPEIVTRPWRRSPLLQIQIQNGSALPADLTVRLRRGKTKEKIQDDTEPFETIKQALPARTGGALNCATPASETTDSYYLALTAQARTADHREIPLAEPEPIYVRHVPWLRRGRDWAALGGAAFALLWLAFGIPVSRAPFVHVRP